MSGVFVSSLMSHGVYECYAKDLAKAIQEQAGSWRAGGQSCYIEAAATEDFCYPVEYDNRTKQIFVHLYGKGPISIADDGFSDADVSKSFAYPSGLLLTHKVAPRIDDLSDEITNCKIFAGSPHVVQIKHVGQKGILFEYMNGGDLTRLPSQLTTAQKVDIVKQTIHAVATIHSKEMVFRDLRPQHFLFDRDANGTFTIKICNIACATKSGQRTMQHGWVDYRSPELLCNRTRQVYDKVSNYVPDPKDDLWALGLTIYEIIHGKQVPFCQTIKKLFLEDHTKVEMDAGLIDLQNEISTFCKDTLENTPLDRIVWALLNGRINNTKELLDNPIFAG